MYIGDLSPLFILSHGKLHSFLLPSLPSIAIPSQESSLPCSVTRPLNSHPPRLQLSRDRALNSRLNKAMTLMAMSTADAGSSSYSKV